MADISDIVQSIFPSNGAVGIVLTDTIRITFDRAMDEDCLKQSIIVEGPDRDEVIWNTYIPTTLKDGSEDRLLESPGYDGIVPGTFTFERLDPVSGLPVDIEDTTGDGTLYHTRVTFKPDQPFAPDTVYRVHIVGDQDLTDDEDFGSKDRSVFDIVPAGTNTSTGEIVMGGTYDGSVSNDTLNLRIVESGLLGQATFEWWLDSVPLDLKGPAVTHTNTLPLIKGTTVRFEEGAYQENDEWTVRLIRPEFFEGQLYSEFTTGTGNIVPVAADTSTSPVGTPLPPTTAADFKVVRTSPEDGAANLPVEKYDRIVVEFSDVIDPSSVTQESVIVTAEPVINHPSLSVSSPDGEIAKILTVSGNLLYIDI